MGGVREIVRALAGPSSLAAMLPEFLRGQRWFGGKAQPIGAVSLTDAITLQVRDTTAFLFLVRVEYREGPAETYAVPMMDARDLASVPHLATGEVAPHLPVTAEEMNMVLYDAFRAPEFLEALLDVVREGRRVRGEHGELRAMPTTALDRLTSGQELTPRLLRAEQSNTSVVYGDRLVFKVFRRVAEGVNPDVEIGRFLTEKTDYRNVPLLAGSMEYVSDAGVCSSIGILQSFVRNEGDAWEFTLAAVGRYLAKAKPSGAPAIPARTLLELAAEPIPQPARESVGEYIESAALLGHRTAELHLALSTHAEDAAFEPEEFSAADQRNLCESALALLERNFRMLKRQVPSLPPAVQAEADDVLALAPELERLFSEMEERPIHALRTRIHGDYHLGQILVVEPEQQIPRSARNDKVESARNEKVGSARNEKTETDKDFVIIDFEGEPARSLEERRRKRSPLQDVAGMLRSFHYAAFAPLLGIGPESLPLETYGPWASLWQTWVSAAFLREYLAVAGSAAFLPSEREGIEALLNVLLLEKAVYELGYELNNRPSWVRVPLSGIEQLLGTRDKGQGARQDRRRIA